MRSNSSSFLQRERRKRWTSSEKEIARRIKGKVVPGSGSQTFAKGDVKNSRVLIENKFTEKDGFRITKRLLKKIEAEAAESNAEGRIPILRIDFGSRCYYVIRDSDFDGLGGSLD